MEKFQKLIMILTIILTNSLERNINIFTEEKPVAIVDAEFLSIVLGAAIVKHKFKSIDFKSEKLLTLAKGLSSNSLKSNVYLRVGGSLGDDDVFNPTMYIFNATEFEQLYLFTKKLKWKLIFGLNLLLRKSDGTWDSTNAESLIDFISTKGYHVNYELGNEPDLWPTHRNITIKPEQIANDFLTLKNILLQYDSQGKLFGPDICTLTRYDYFENILRNMKDNVLDAITFHHYYGSSSNVSPANFTSVKYLDSFINYGNKAFQIIIKSIKSFQHPPVWVGETSSTYGGGSDIGMSFVAGFLWLDKLGVAAQMNISVVIRQTLTGNHYSLIHRDYTSSPDYWISLLHKKLVGRRVLNITDYLKLGKEVRVYAHCINPYGEMGYSPYGIVLMVLNLNQTQTASIVIKNPTLKSLDIDQYLFSPLNGNLDDKDVSLNGEVLRMSSNTTLPKLRPLRIKQPIQIPPLRYGFYVLLDSHANACIQ